MTKARALCTGALVLSLAAVAATARGADDSQYLRNNVLYFLERSDATAHVRIHAYRGVQDYMSGQTVGYRRFLVSDQVLEGFKGITPGLVEFLVTQEQPSNPPTGDYIVSLSRSEEGDWYFADDSVMWVRATPELLATARSGR